MCRPSVVDEVWGEPSISATLAARAVTHAVASAAAALGEGPRALIWISTVSCGCDAVMLLASPAVDVGRPRPRIDGSFRTAVATSVLLAIDRYDVTRDLASAAPMEAFASALPSLEPVLGPLVAVTRPVAPAWYTLGWVA